MFESMMSPPPRWLWLIHAAGFWVTALILALTFMVQWMFLMGCGMHFLGIPGLVLGGVVVAAQICAMFLTPESKNSCSL